MQENIERLIRIPVQDSKENYLGGFWRWVDLMAQDDDQAATEGLYWPNGSTWTPGGLKERDHVLRWQ